MTCKPVGGTSKSRGKDAKIPWQLTANTTPSLKTKLVVWPLLTNTGGSCPHSDTLMGPKRRAAWRRSHLVLDPAICGPGVRSPVGSQPGSSTWATLGDPGSLLCLEWH